MSERVFVAVDVNNLWSTCQDLFGEEYRISYPALLDRIYSFDRDLLLHAYVVPMPYQRIDRSGQLIITPPKNKRFIEYLENVGFSVKERRMRYERLTMNPFGANWDIRIDATTNLDSYDTFVLFSGNGDYQVLIEDLKECGKRVEVATFRTGFSHLLHGRADEIIYLGESEVFKEKPVGRIRRDSA